MKFVSTLGMILSLRTAWRKARIDAAFREEEWRVRRGLAAELAKMRAVRKTIEEFKREAAEMISAAPWSREVVVELLQQRLQALKRVVSGINQREVSD